MSLGVIKASFELFSYFLGLTERDSHMRRFATILTTIGLVLSGSLLSPANASTVSCSGGGTFTITGDEVTDVSNDCDGVVTIPEGVVGFSPYVFDGRNVTEFFLPSSFVGWDAYIDFSSLRELTKFTVSSSNSNYSADSSGVLFNKDKTTVLLYPQGKTDSSYSIPWGVLRIENGSFYEAQFTSVQIPGTATSIGISAFMGSSLTSVVIPASVTTLQYYAFRRNTSLVSVTFAGDPPGPIGETDVFLDVTATVEVSQWQSSAWATKLSEYNDQYTDLTLSSGNVYNFYNNGGIGHEPTPQWLSTLTSAFTTPTTTATKAGYTFTGWNTQPDRSGRSYLPGFAYENLGDVNLYAQWAPNLNDVSFSSNGGTTVSSGSFLTGSSVSAPTAPTRDGYSFAGWSVTDGGSPITFPYSPTATTDMTLYAKWTQNPTRAFATVKPSVSGTAKVTKTLSVKKGTWTGYPIPAFTYQWYSCSKAVATAQATVPGNCKKISGSTKSPLKLLNAQKGQFISVLVTGTSAGTSATKWLSKSTAIVK
jgi:uncharacterized repeat protein (TIGR02543 family)